MRRMPNSDHGRFYVARQRWRYYVRHTHDEGAPVISVAFWSYYSALKVAQALWLTRDRRWIFGYGDAILPPSQAAEEQQDRQHGSQDAQEPQKATSSA